MKIVQIKVFRYSFSPLNVHNIKKMIIFADDKTAHATTAVI